MPSTLGVNNNQNQALDPKIKALASAILQKESNGNYKASGGSGEGGGYQFMPATWKSWAGKHLGNSNAEMSVENQNRVAYGQIKEWKDKGLNPAQIASKWNSGNENAYKNNHKGVNKYGVAYDTPKYVQDVSAIYQQKTQALQAPQAPQEPVMSTRQQEDIAATERYNPTFAPNTVNPSLAAEGAKTVANVPKSAWNFVKGAIDLVNPISTYKNIKEVIGGFKGLAGEAGGYGEAAKAFTSAIPGAAYELVPESTRGAVKAVGGYIKGDEEQIDTGLQQAHRAIVSDPVGQIAPYLMAGKYGAEKAGIGPKFDAAISKTAQVVTKPVSTLIGKAKGSAGGATKFAVGQATGLSPETIGQITKTPEAFTKASRAKIDRASLGKEVQSSLTKRAESLAETGAAYAPIRKSAVPIKVSKSWLESTIENATKLDLKYGIDDINYARGKFQAKGSSLLRDSADVRAVQHLYDLWKPVFEKGKITPNEFLNFRTDLTNLSKFERQVGKSKPVESVAKLTRNKFNKDYRSQLKGLAELDKEFGTQIGQLKDLSKGMIDKRGNLTDEAMNRIANASGKGKDILLSRLEETVPGITKKIKILEAVEDIQNASGIKVGTYTRGAAIGGGFVLGGPIQGIIAAILTSPELAVPLLRRYGLLKNSTAVRAVIQALRSGNEVPNRAAAGGNRKTPEIAEKPTAFTVKKVGDSKANKKSTSEK